MVESRLDSHQERDAPLERWWGGARRRDLFPTEWTPKFIVLYGGGSEGGGLMPDVKALRVPGEM